MISYQGKHITTIHTRQGRKVYSFISLDENNIDWNTVTSFGKEWQKFSSFESPEITTIGNDYFDLINASMANGNSVALDVGCGSGRWARYLSRHVKFIEAIDPSEAALVAAEKLRDLTNVRVTQAGVDKIPFPDKSFDFVYSLGVLHHIPDTQSAINKCLSKLKPQGWLLVYLYYALDNRGAIYKLIFHTSTFFRRIISRLPSSPKLFVCDLIAFFIYFPLAYLAKNLYSVTPLRFIAEKIPLGYYRKTSFQVMRNDALDRFGTPLEKRFSKIEIEEMLLRAGFINIHFSPNAPYWHVVAQRP